MNKSQLLDVKKYSIFGNWVDQYYYPITKKLVPFVARYHFITPNLISIFSFSLYVIGCIFLFLSLPYHLFYSAILLPIAYIGDQLDGQLARYIKKSSNFGDFFDKVLDVLKIYIIMASIGYTEYIKTNNVFFIFLGLTGAFFFMFRYYIKLETALQKAINDNQYLDKCSQLQNQLEKDTVNLYLKLSSRGIVSKVRVWWMKNKSILIMDEGEIVFFTVLGAICNRLDLTLYFLVISQVFLGFLRFYQRGYQINNNSTELYKPIRR